MFSVDACFFVCGFKGSNIEMVGNVKQSGPGCVFFWCL